MFQSSGATRWINDQKALTAQGLLTFEGEGRPSHKLLMNRKKAHPIDVGSLARAYTERAIIRLGGIMENSADENVAVSASKVLLERGWGRPIETKELKGELKVVLRHMLGDEK